MLEKDLSRALHHFATPVQTVLPNGVTVGEALAELRKKEIQQKIIYFYVVDERQGLKGVVSTRQLLLADPATSVQDVMQSAVIKLRAKEPLKAALELFAKHPLLAIPIVDEMDCLLGTIDVQMVTDEMIDIADSTTRFDVFQMIGLSLEDGNRPSLRTGYRLRMPWLLCNVFSGVVCAIISGMYEVVLGKYLLLAFFIPLVLTLSESTSMQSMTQSLLFLRRPRFKWKMAMMRAFREWQLAVLLAASSGLIVGALSLLWGDGFLPSLCIGLGIFLSVTLSVIFGISLPVLLHKMKLDPKVASGPVVLMIADMLTTALYLSLSAWWLL